MLQNKLLVKWLLKNKIAKNNVTFILPNFIARYLNP